MSTIVRQEGPLALYKGFAATFARQCPYVVITWLTVERLPLGRVDMTSLGGILWFSEGFEAKGTQIMWHLRDIKSVLTALRSEEEDHEGLVSSHRLSLPSLACQCHYFPTSACLRGQESTASSVPKWHGLASKGVAKPILRPRRP